MPENLFDLTGEVAVVIGATGVLGGAIAEGLAKAGATVAGAEICGLGCGGAAAMRGAELPVASYFGITRRWPGRKVEPFGRLLASAMA